MAEEMMVKIFEMISTAGAARSKYIEAMQKAKNGGFEEAEALIKEGGDCYSQAHAVHAQMLAEESGNLEGEEGKSNVNLILVHAEDQMMCAETFRLMAEEFIEVYKKLNQQ